MLRHEGVRAACNIPKLPLSVIDPNKNTESINPLVQMLRGWKQRQNVVDSVSAKAKLVDDITNIQPPPPRKK